VSDHADGDGPPAKPPTVAAEALQLSDLESKNKQQLLAIAGHLGLRVSARLTKADVISRILDTTEPAATPPRADSEVSADDENLVSAITTDDPVASADPARDQSVQDRPPIDQAGRDRSRDDAARGERQSGARQQQGRNQQGRNQQGRQRQVRQHGERQPGSRIHKTDAKKRSIPRGYIAAAVLTVALIISFVAWPSDASEPVAVPTPDQAGPENAENLQIPPGVASFEGARLDVDDLSCGWGDGTWQAEGSVTNSALESRAYRIYVAFVDPDGGTAGISQANVAPLAPGSTTSWSTRLDLRWPQEPDLRCVLRVERHVPE
jgi:hypothetical protein